MEKAVILEYSEVITPLGNLEESTADLIDGSCALVPGPCFGVPIPCAPFPDIRCRDLAHTVSLLAKKLPLDSFKPAETLFIYCAAKGDVRSLEETVINGVATANISPLLDQQPQTICALLNIRPARTIVISNACASGAVGIETAADYLRNEQYTHAILFGFDALSRFTTTGFYSLNALSPIGARPFDAQRDGLTMGEGAGIALLSFREPCSGDCIIRGAGSSNDANHRTGPSRTGEGLYNAAKAALVDAGLNAVDIGGVKCHGTATVYNDAMEAKALYTLFHNACPPCVSLKGAIGHLSGAGSLIEAAIAASCLKRGVLPPTMGFEQSGVEEPIGISAQVQKIEKPVLLCLAAGFGGLNAATIIEERE